jgi:hypothetical protein
VTCSRGSGAVHAWNDRAGPPLGWGWRNHPPTARWSIASTPPPASSRRRRCRPGSEVVTRVTTEGGRGDLTAGAPTTEEYINSRSASAKRRESHPRTRLD